MRLVVDANAILQDARHVAKSDNLQVRPMLEELMDSHVLRCAAPDSVIDEVGRRLPEVIEGLDDARRTRALELWERYRSKIQWVESSVHADSAKRFPLLAARDPSDVPLASVFAACGADAIMSDDRDLVDSTEVVTVKRTALAPVRAYARAKAPAVAATTVPVLVVANSIAVAIELYAAVPDPWKLLVILGSLALLISAYLVSAAEDHVSIRAWLARWADETCSLVAAAAAAEAAVVRALPSCAARSSTNQPSASLG